jgi:chemotaxis family two-component system response regulator Rcp1
MTECLPKEKIQVLVVEDNPGDARLLKEACVHMATHFHYVQNGEEALDFLFGRGGFASVKRPDLMILDLNLPRVNGIEVLAEIKSDPELRLIPIIVFSSSNSDEEIRNVYGAQVACVVKKPHDLEAFLSGCEAIVRFWLEYVCYPARVD